MYTFIDKYVYVYVYIIQTRRDARLHANLATVETFNRPGVRGGGLGSRPKKMYGERLGDGVEYHLLSPTPHR